MDGNGLNPTYDGYYVQLSSIYADGNPRVHIICESKKMGRCGSNSEINGGAEH